MTVGDGPPDPLCRLLNVVVTEMSITERHADVGMA